MVIRGYLPYYSRSVLAKAQLYSWIHQITGRMWLVDVGDANELQSLSPASLTEGYAPVDVIYKAPTCLRDSESALSMELFQHVVASCRFTSTAQHSGNAARPWEYHESLRSMIALDFETAGYDLIRRSIRYGDYLDRKCLCSAFTINPRKGPCPGPEQLDFTEERLWMNATCGPTSLPDNWTELLKTTDFAYIPMKDWYWPKCVTDMPKQMIELTGQCASNACERDSGGYCKVKRAVDRACFCRNISYDSCGGSCQIFETRIDYVKWLNGLCGSVRDWHGLPNHWRQLAAPTPGDMIPWRWTIKPLRRSKNTSIIPPGSIEVTQECPSTEWKLGSLALVNIATFIAILLSRRTKVHKITSKFLWSPGPSQWFFMGFSIAALQLLANWINASLVQKMLDYEEIPVFQLMIFWCSMPRLAWLTIFLIGSQSFNAMEVSAAASSLLVEMTLQLISAYYMILTVNYGREHDFFLGGLDGVERPGSARLMYTGALLWLIVISLAFIQLIRTARMINELTESGSLNLPKWQRSKQTSLNIADHAATKGEHCTRLWENLGHCGYKIRAFEQTALLGSERGAHMEYGTIPVRSQNDWFPQTGLVRLHAVTVISMLLLYIAQWLFWAGFIGLSLEEFCPPELGILTAVWVTFSVAGVFIGATFQTYIAYK